MSCATGTANGPGRPEADPSTYLQFFHGTTPENARLIRDQGLRAGGYDGHDPVLTPDSSEARSSRTSGMRN